MLRVFKLTSPMSVGSWVLAAFGGAASTGCRRCAWPGSFPAAGAAPQRVAAVLGPPLATYTAALVANTAVPVWHEARRKLPFVFAAGAAASAGAAAALVTPAEHAGARAPARGRRRGRRDRGARRRWSDASASSRTPMRAPLQRQRTRRSRPAGRSSPAGRRSRTAAVAGGRSHGGALLTR